MCSAVMSTDASPESYPVGTSVPEANRVRVRVSVRNPKVGSIEISERGDLGLESGGKCPAIGSKGKGRRISP